MACGERAPFPRRPGAVPDGHETSGTFSARFRDLSHLDVERFGACHRLRGGAAERVGDLDADGRRRSRGAVTPHVGVAGRLERSGAACVGDLVQPKSLGVTGPRAKPSAAAAVASDSAQHRFFGNGFPWGALFRRGVEYEDVLVVFRIVGGDSAGRVSQVELVLADLDALGFERPEHRNADLGQFVLVRHDGHLRPLLDDVALEVEHRDVGERAARVERAEEVVVRLPLGVVESVFVDVVALPVVVGGAARAVSRLEEARPGDGRQRREVVAAHHHADRVGRSGPVGLEAVGAGDRYVGHRGLFRLAQLVDDETPVGRIFAVAVVDRQQVVLRVDRGVQVGVVADVIVVVALVGLDGGSLHVFDAPHQFFVPVLAFGVADAVGSGPQVTVGAVLFEGGVRPVAEVGEFHVVLVLGLHVRGLVGLRADPVQLRLVRVGELRVPDRAVRVEVEALHRRVVRQVGVPAEDVRGIEPVDARGRRFVGTFGFAGTGRFAAVSVAAAGGAEREAQN